MAKLYVFGSSDDLIEFRGALYDEFNAIDTDSDPAIIGFSDGTLVEARYVNGTWGFRPIKYGKATIEVRKSGDVGDEFPEASHYTGVLELEGDIEWAMCSTMEDSQLIE